MENNIFKWSWRGSDNHLPIYGADSYSPSPNGFPSDEEWRRHGGFAPDLEGDDWYKGGGGTKVPRQPKPPKPNRSGGMALPLPKEQVLETFPLKRIGAR